MSALPGPGATRAEVEAFRAAQEKTARSRRASDANRSANRTCSSCGEPGHVRGVRACPNYDSPVRWQAHGKVWVRP